MNAYTAPIENGEFVAIDKLSKIKRDSLSNNYKAMNSIMCALLPTEFKKNSGCDTAKEIWDKLCIMNEGTIQDTKISMLVHEYELFRVDEDEFIDVMFTRFTNIIIDLKRLGN